MHLLNVCIYFKIDYSTYFKDVIQYYYCQLSPVSALLIEVYVGVWDVTFGTRLSVRLIEGVRLIGRGT